MITLIALMSAGTAMAGNGDMAPPFALDDLQGNRVSLAALKGDVVVIHFATSW